MATKSEIVVRVESRRGSTLVSYRTKGKYVSFTTAGLSADLPRQPLMPTSSLAAYWLAVLGLVVDNITAGE